MLIPSTDLDTSAPRWHAHGLIPEQGVINWWGPSNEGKSLTALQLSLATTSGTPFLGLAVQQGPVVYALSEGLYDFGVRKEAAMRHDPGLQEDGFVIKTGPFSLADPAVVIALAGQLTPLAPRLVICDALSGFTQPGASLESPSGAAKVMAGAHGLAAGLQCAVVLIHHAGKTREKMRGAQVLHDCADAVLKVDGGVITAEKMKYGPIPRPLQFAIEPVTWQDVNGDDVETAVASLPQQSGIDLRSVAARFTARAPGAARRTGLKVAS